nr:AEC family transporter [Mobiluncus porci]
MALWSLLAIIAAGFVLAKVGLAPAGSDTAITKVCFALPLPAMIFQAVQPAHISEVFSKGLLVNVLAATALFAVYYFLAIRFFGLRDGEQTIGALAASYTNAGNIGIPYLVAITGDPTLAAAIMLFQLGVMMPVSFWLLGRQTDQRNNRLNSKIAGVSDVTRENLPISGNSGSDGKNHTSDGTDSKMNPQKTPSKLHFALASFRASLVPVIKQPPLYGLVIGLIWGATGLPVPEVIHAPVNMLATAVVPMLMLAVGINAARSTFKEMGSELPALSTAVVFRVILSPLVTYGLCLAFGVSGKMLLASMVVASFPTANNVFVYAMKFGAGSRLAANAMIVTTLLSFPIVTLVALLFR